MRHYINPKDVVEAWINGYASDSIFVWSDGTSLFHGSTIIAERKNSRTVLYNGTPYRSSHIKETQRILCGMMNTMKEKIYFTTGVKLGSKSLFMPW